MAGPLHTEGNAVPSLDGTELGGILDDLYGFDEGIDLIVDGIRLIALRRLPVERVQLLLATIAGSPDGTDLIGAFARLAERIADSDNSPALRELPLDIQKDAALHGANTAYALLDPELRGPASEACAALDNHAHYSPVRHCTKCGWSTDNPKETVCDCPPYFT